MKYDPQMIKPIREKITRLDVEDLRDVDDVKDFLDRDGTSMIFVNSVCGCVGEVAVPALEDALDHDVLPDHLGTVFAGQDREATEHVRNLAPDCDPSSPSIYLFEDGSPEYYVHRKSIKGNAAERVAEDLKSKFKELNAPAKAES